MSFQARKNLLFPSPLWGRAREGVTPRDVSAVWHPHPQPLPARGRGAEVHTLMRVVGGRLKGRNLASPSSRDIRPTADRLRESLFNILIHGYGDPIADARVLDLFAGTGALGIEAISRGAAFALFVDNGAEARALLRNNVEALGLGGVTKVYRRDAGNLGPAHPVEPFSLVFLDPPYGRSLAEKALASLRDGGWLDAAAMLWSRRPRRRRSPRRKVSRNWNGARTTIRNLCFCEPLRLVMTVSATWGSVWPHRRPNSFSISFSFNST